MSRSAPIKNRIIEHRLVKASELLKHPLNYRLHPERQKKLLHQSLSEIGHAKSLTAYETPQGLRLIDGHLRADMDPEAMLPVEVLDVTDAEARQLLLTLDPLASLAETDSAILDDLLKSTKTTGDLDVWLKERAEDAGIDNPQSDPDDIDDLAAKKKELLDKYKVKKGDIWQLGQHLLLCGDCRDEQSVGRFIGDAKVNLCFTSPPYASQRKYDEASGFKPIKPEAYGEWFEPVQANVKKHLAADGSFFVNIKEHTEDSQRSLYVKDFCLSMSRGWSWLLIDELCWLRNSVPGRYNNRFKNGFEPVFHFSLTTKIKFNPDDVSQPTDNAFTYVPGSYQTTPGGVNMNTGKSEKPGLALPSNVIPSSGVAGKLHDAVKHVAAFPVGLPSFFIKAFSDESDLVLDPFSGSGTTLIACELLKRKSLDIEISPEYCALTLERWHKQTGQTPKRVSSVASDTPPHQGGEGGSIPTETLMIPPVV